MKNLRLLPVLALLALGACSDNNLPDALFANQVDTLVLASIDGTPIAFASAYSVLDARVVRTDQSSGFDFAFLSDGVTHSLVPQDGFGLGTRSSNPGLFASNEQFEGLTNPPSDGYVTADSIAVSVGDVFVVRSRLCFLGVPQYGKVEVLSIDAAQRFVTLRIMANINCGYRSLVNGIPTE